MKRLVFFDLDGTILGGFSSENVFIFYLLRHGYIGVKQFLHAFLFFIRWTFLFKHRVFIKNKAYLTGLPVKQIQSLAKTFVKERLVKHIRPQLQACIDEHRQAGDELFLITGSPSFLADEIAHYLHIDHVEPTHCQQDEVIFHAGIPWQHPFAEDKLKIAQKLCEQHGADIKQAFAYGNSYNDRMILEAVGHPVAVTPDRQLRKLAWRKGWKIIDPV